MLLKLLLLFTTIPFVELWLLFAIGKRIGAGWTLALVILSGFLGVYLVRAQGLHLLYKIREEIRRGRLPADEMMDGVCILAGGILLLTPGLLTDLTGFSLLFPAVRKLVKETAIRLIRKKFA
jgi:UPF0716 protein FxsA